MESKTTILVVEDDPILKNLLGHSLSGEYHMLYASNGAEALAIAQDSKPAVILLDLMMPDMDGFTFLEKTHEHEDIFKSVPIIVVSNISQKEDKDRAESLGVSGYLVKAEVSVEEIVKKIKEVLGANNIASNSSEDNLHISNTENQNPSTI